MSDVIDFYAGTSFPVSTINSKQKKGIKSSIGRLFGKKEKGGRMEQTMGRDGQPLPALSGPTPPLTHSKTNRFVWCTEIYMISAAFPDFEMGIGDTMTLGKLGTQAERDRRMKKK